MIKEDITPYEIGWAAGIIDGEGCIYISKHVNRQRTRSHYSLELRVNNTDLQMCEKFKELFGGEIYTAYTNKSIRTLYEWKVSTVKSSIILKLLEPYLITKKEQARIAIEFGELERKSRDLGVQMAREDLYEELKQLR